MEVDPKLKSAVEKLKSGNDEAFNEVYQKTYNYVYFRAKQVMKNEDDAMDLMQTVYMEAYKSIKSLDKAESIYSWLSSITFRQGMKIFQKKKEILLDEDFENIFDAVETSDMDSRPDISFERKEQQRLVAELIDSLPEVQRATMVAFYYDNIKIEEIAEVMDCSVGTVKSRLSYARQALKKKLEAVEKKEGKSGAGKMVLTGALIFGAVQIMSEETVLAAPLAAGVFGNICSGLGIAATGAAVAGSAIAGSAMAGGAGISAATGTVAGTASAAAGAALAGSAAAGTAATAAGTAAAAGTAGVGAAAAGAAGTAAAGAGAAKGIAVAVAVAVAGTGGTVGTTIYRNTVSSADKVSSNEEAAYDAEDILESAVSTEVYDTADTAAYIDPSEAGDGYDESCEASGNGDITGDESDDTVEESSPDSPDEQTDTTESPVEAEADEEDDAAGEYRMTDKLKKHIASAVASLFMTGSGNIYNGEVSNENLEAAYILEKNLFKSKKEIKALSGNSIFLSHPEVESSVVEDGIITLKGSFDVGRTDEKDNVSTDKYSFVLHGNRLDEKGLFGHFNAIDLEMEHKGNKEEKKAEEEKKPEEENGAVSANEAEPATEASTEVNTEKEPEPVIEAFVPEIIEAEESGVIEAPVTEFTVTE